MTHTHTHTHTHKYTPAPQALNKVLEAEKAAWQSEHGEVYSEGIKPMFSEKKCRVYDSYWNWYVTPVGVGVSGCLFHRGRASY